MKNLIYVFLFSLMITSVGCRLDGADESIKPIIDPPPLILVDRDSISTGGYLGIQINENATNAYAAVQSLQEAQGVGYVNIVGNGTSDLSQLQGRIPLYSYILLDQSQGTDSGIQITLEAGKVKAIYLNSGEKLSQWPKKENIKSSIRLGDESGALYEKMVRIQAMSKYREKFERIMLQTKDLTTGYDPGMAQSRQWYFAYTTPANLLEVVNIHLKNEKIAYIVIERFK